MEQEKDLFEIIRTAERMTGKKIQTMDWMKTDETNVVSVIGVPQGKLLGLILDDESGDPLAMPFIRGYRCTMRFGKEKKYFIDLENKPVETTAEALIEQLNSYDLLGTPAVFTIELPNPALKGLTLRLYASDSDFDDLDTKQIAMQSDYCFMMLSATALLSMSERRLLRKHLMPELGEALGILLVQYELIADDLKADVDNSLKTFFGDAYPISKLVDRVKDFYQAVAAITPQLDHLRSVRGKRAISICLQETLDSVKTMIDMLSSESEKIDDALQLLQEKAAQLPSRQEAASRHSRMKYISPKRVEYASALSEFYQSITERLHDGIAKGEDVLKMQEMIPEYLDTEWKREAEQIISSLEDETCMLREYLAEDIDNDFNDFLGADGNDGVASYVFRVSSLYPNETDSPLDVTIVKDKTTLKKGGTVAAGLACMLLAGHPIIGAGIAIYGMTKAGKGETLKTLEKNRQNLVSAADMMCTNYYDNANEWLTSVFNEIEANINDCIKNSYSKIMDAMIDAVKARKADAASRQDEMLKYRELETKLTNAVNDAKA